MSWVATALGVVPKKERAGIRLNRSAPWWVIGGFEEYPPLLRKLSGLVPDGSVLYLEGEVMATAVEEFLQSRKAERIAKVAMRTVWPRPETFHVPLDAQNLSELARLVERYRMEHICDHFVVYHNETVLLECHHVLRRRISLSGELPEAAVRAFCKAAGCAYRRSEPNASRSSPPAGRAESSM